MRVFSETFGFRDMSHFISTTTPSADAMKVVAIISPIVTLLEYFFGVPVEWLFGILIGIFFEAIIGAYASIKAGQKFRTNKFGRVMVKIFFFGGTVAVINFIKIGFLKMDIKLEHLKTFIDYTVDTIFVCTLLMMAVYLLSSIAENGAKLNWPFFKTLARIMKIKIKDADEFIQNS